MNSLGGGGSQSPWLVNAANALTFCLMVLTCALSGIFVKRIVELTPEQAARKGVEKRTTRPRPATSTETTR